MDIEKWLENKGETFENPIIKIRLMEMVKRIKPLYNKYVIDEYMKSKDMIILHLAPYHCELKPPQIIMGFSQKLC